MPTSSLSRFLEAQNKRFAGYQQALTEIKNGYKSGHWIWYIFPQMKDLGYSSMSRFYGITSLKEAEEYMKNETLSGRLREITAALLEHADKRAEDILGYVDAMKVKSSMTLFDAVCPGDVFEKVLVQFYGGERCGRTLRMIEGG